MDLTASGAAPVTDIGASLHRDAPIVVLDTTTGKRNPYWAELDVSAARDGETDPVLYVRPAVNYVEGHHYVVGPPPSEEPNGAELQPTAAFRAYRDRLFTGNSARGPAPGDEKVLKKLAGRRGAPPGPLSAWDFTVASERNLSERVLPHARRRHAPHSVGRASLHFTVTPADQVTDTPREPAGGWSRAPSTYR